MRISFDKAVNCALEYMSDLVITIPKQIDKWLGTAAVVGLKTNPEPIKAKVRPWLEMAGILSGGMVNIETLKSSLEAAFAAVPRITYFGFTFTIDDVPVLLAKMQQGESPTPVTTEVVNDG